VGPIYGRKMMKGYIKSNKGINISERKLKGIMPLLAPINHSMRQSNSHERRNPAVYSARYFGHKIHFDQNEKLVNYGVTYVMARDGYSGKIVGAAIMPRKNNEVIYANVFRAAVNEYGLWNQLRVDHGKEFYLTLYIQEKLRIGRGDSTIPPYVQTTSTCNHIIERIWVELNQRVTYPVKRIIKNMDDCRSMNMDCPITKFCVSNVLLQICEVGMRRMISAWNSHPIPHRGIPNELQRQAFNTAPIQPGEIPVATEAVIHYRDQGGHLRDPAAFGTDPLENDLDLCRQRHERWLIKCGMDVDQMFSRIISGDHSVLENAVLDFIDLTSDMSNE
jgi:hypothetical protein